MKFLVFFFITLHILPQAYAETSAVYSIDDYDYGPTYVEVSEEALPPDYHAEVLALTSTFGFSLLTDDQVNSLFEVFKKDINARNRMAGGACATRRAYIQNFLKRINLSTGRLYISCPAFNGRMRLRDRATNHNYHFANYHDTNIIAVMTPKGKAYRVLDVQFEDGPVSLQDYLAEVEASQRIRPLERMGDTKKICYWKISQ